MGPDHAPDAEQELAFAEDQVSIEDPPLATDAGFAASNTVGPGGVGAPGSAGIHWGSLPPPPQAATAKVSRETSGHALSRNMAVPIS